MIQLVAEFLLSHLTWTGVSFNDPSSEFEEPSSSDSTTTRSIRFLDYACGPGTLTAIFMPYVTEAIGIDISENMVEAYNARFSDAEPSLNSTSNPKQQKAAAVVGDMLSSDPPTWTQDEKFQSFNFAAVGFGFHHFDNLPQCTERLVQRLKPSTGIFMIVDFFDDGQPNSNHDHHHGHGRHHVSPSGGIGSSEAAEATVTHPHGFTSGMVDELFTSAGLGDIKMEILDEVVVMEKEREGRKRVEEKKIFVAVGRRDS